MVQTMVTPVNPNKTKAMFFRMKRSVDPQNSMFQQCQIEYVSIHKQTDGQTEKVTYQYCLNQNYFT
jgi:hypothetical protein